MPNLLNAEILIQLSSAFWTVCVNDHHLTPEIPDIAKEYGHTIRRLTLQIYHADCEARINPSTRFALQ